MRLAQWRQLARSVSTYPTPFFLICGEPLAANYKRLQRQAEVAGTVRQWYSFKTLPIPHVAAYAKTLGMGMEATSKFELAAAEQLGFKSEDILVNGVGKHAWLGGGARRLNVVFDSVHEIRQLAPVAKQQEWRCGLRVAVSQQVNSDTPGQPAQFGIKPHDLSEARELLTEAAVSVDILHFHLHSNVSDTKEYDGAIQELSDSAKAIGLSPSVVDIGGGLPDSTLDPTAEDAAEARLTQYLDALYRLKDGYFSAAEIWLENGRYLLGPTGVLVVTVLDIKFVDQTRILICDGGRTNQALPSSWERHIVEPAEAEHASLKLSTVACGPTCMAFDSFYQGPLSASIGIGDRLMYLNAGAYHIPWENRFSTGLCAVLWSSDGSPPVLIRQPESIADRWALWVSAR